MTDEPPQDTANTELRDAINQMRESLSVAYWRMREGGYTHGAARDHLLQEVNEEVHQGADDFAKEKP